MDTLLRDTAIKPSTKSQNPSEIWLMVDGSIAIGVNEGGDPFHATVMKSQGYPFLD